MFTVIGKAQKDGKDFYNLETHGQFYDEVIRQLKSKIDRHLFFNQ
jgi:hypothetical protein